MAVQKFPLRSSAIDLIWYDAETQDLWVKFRKTKNYPKYHYEGVSTELVAEWLNAGSHGQFFHQRIDGNFHSTEITQPEQDGSLNIFQTLRGFTG